MTQLTELLPEGLEQRVRNAPEGDLWVTLPAPRIPLEVVQAHPDVSCCWVPPSEASAGAVAWVGVGRGCVFEANGPERFESIRRTAGAALERLNVVVDRSSELGDAGALRPRVFGGFAFQPGSAAGPPWQGFGDARFVLPKLLYQRDARSATLGLFIPSAERRNAASDLSSARQLCAELEGMSTRAASSGRGELPQAFAHGVDAVPHQDWTEMVEAIVREIRAGRFEKVVAARRTTLEFDAPLAFAATLAALESGHRHCTRFAFRVGAAAFVGVTPERLVQKFGASVSSEALAGTFRRTEGAFAEELLRSPKEHEEHQPVLDAVVQTLRPFCGELDYPKQPQLRELRDLFHLHTPVRGRLERPVHVLELVRALHPTPAVGGAPTDAAMQWIARHELHDRGWYAGPVGWFDADGDGEFAVALRSGVLLGRRAYLYAGAGIVLGSEPAREYQETELKLRALLGALRQEG